jgi:TolA-binding protein
MDDSSIIAILSAVVGALGIKEIWNIWKKKIDIQAKKDITSLHKEHQILHEVIDEQRNTIEEMTKRIISLEEKIEALIEENKECAIKLARMEERLLANAKNKSTRKRPSTKKAS